MSEGILVPAEYLNTQRVSQSKERYLLISGKSQQKFINLWKLRLWLLPQRGIQDLKELIKSTKSHTLQYTKWYAEKQ